MYKHDFKSPDSPMTPNTLGLDWSPSLALHNQNNAISYKHIESISVLKF